MGRASSFCSHRFKGKQLSSLTISLILTIDNKEFDILKKKSKDYHMLIKKIIALYPKNSKHLCQDFNLTQDQLKKVFLLPHEVAFEPYLKGFQYKVLN